MRSEEAHAQRNWKQEFARRTAVMPFTRFVANGEPLPVEQGNVDKMAAEDGGGTWYMFPDAEGLQASYGGVPEDPTTGQEAQGGPLHGDTGRGEKYAGGNVESDLTVNPAPQAEGKGSQTGSKGIQRHQYGDGAAIGGAVDRSDTNPALRGSFAARAGAASTQVEKPEAYADEPGVIRRSHAADWRRKPDSFDKLDTAAEDDGREPGHLIDNTGQEIEGSNRRLSAEQPADEFEDDDFDLGEGPEEDGEDDTKAPPTDENEDDDNPAEAIDVKPLDEHEGSETGGSANPDVQGKTADELKEGEKTVTDEAAQTAVTASHSQTDITASSPGVEATDQPGGKQSADAGEGTAADIENPVADSTDEQEVDRTDHDNDGSKGGSVPADFNDWNKTQLGLYLKKNEVEYDSKADKPTLVKLAEDFRKGLDEKANATGEGSATDLAVQKSDEATPTSGGAQGVD